LDLQEGSAGAFYERQKKKKKLKKTHVATAVGLPNANFSGTRRKIPGGQPEGCREEL